MLALKPTKRDAYIAFIFVFILLFLIAMITNPVFKVNSSTSPFERASAEELLSHVSYLSGITGGRGYNHIDSLNEARQYIENVFLQYCPSTEKQTYTIQGKEFANIICSFNVGGAERIIIGAHYDTYNSLPGADDNASGIAGLLELARMLNENEGKNANNRQIDIVAYTLEEPPFFRSEDMGSFKHAKQLKDNEVNIKAAIILEMIGYYTDIDNSQTFPMSILKPLYPDTGNFIALIGKIGQGDVLRDIKKRLMEATTIDVRSLSGPTFLETIDFSDHRSYWLNDYPAVVITDTSFYRNSNYHTEFDTPNTLDYTRMSDVVNGVYWTVLTL